MTSHEPPKARLAKLDELVEREPYGPSVAEIWVDAVGVTCPHDVNWCEPCWRIKRRIVKAIQCAVEPYRKAVKKAATAGQLDGWPDDTRPEIQGAWDAIMEAHWLWL